MSTTKTNRVVQDQQLLLGLEKHFGKSAVLAFAGGKHKVADLLEALQARVDASSAVVPAKAAFHAAVEKERDAVASSEDTLAALRTWIVAVHGNDRAILSDFGLAPKKERRALTSAEAAQRALKAKATRAARHTMGSRQKAKIKGDVAQATPPATDADAAARPA